MCENFVPVEASQANLDDAAAQAVAAAVPRFPLLRQKISPVNSWEHLGTQEAAECLMLLQVSQAGWECRALA